MQPDLSADQELLRETTARFLAVEMPIPSVRELIERDDGFDRGWWQKGAELGWTSMLVPASAGGGSVSAAPLLDAAIIAEELGRALAPGPFLPTNVVAAALAEAPGGERFATALGSLSSGSATAAWCVDEPGGVWQPAAVRATAERRGDGYVVSGTKSPVEAAPGADLLAVVAHGPDGPVEVLVPATAPGVTIRPLDSLDLVRRFGEVRLDGVEVGADAVIVDGPAAPAALDRQAQVATVLQCADAVGAASRVLEFTLEWVMDRYSFGRPLGSYQALKHRIADMKLWLEASAAIASDAARAVQDDRDDAAEVVSAAVAYVGERATDLVQDCVQLHGGMGVTWEHDIHLFLRRVTTNRCLYGTPDDHRERVAALLGMDGSQR